ncbi:MAG TPA: hypothetical protein VMJ64_04920 [Anaerolineales bacterium]|nr:hypothetical protein [Anaerolineales bacterium]
MKRLLRSPSAYLPLVMSFAALMTVAIYVARNGIAPQPDENAAAHLWQLLMAAQLPIIAFFAIKWLPREPLKTLGVLAIQAAAALAAMAPVFLLRF